MLLALILFLTFLAFMLGGAIASFLGVVVERGKTGESILGNSKCVCGRPLKPWENVPVFGWAFSGGKARCCGARIPVWYFLTELAAGLLFAIPVFLYLASTSSLI